MSVYTSIGFYNLILDLVVERESLKTEEREKIVFSVGKNNSKSLKIIPKKLYLQLATLREHFWRSRGYSLRFIGQARVRDTLKMVKISWWMGSLWECRYQPYTVEDITVRKYSDIDIRHQDVVEAPLLLVPEEGVGHPNFSSIRHCQVFYSTCKKLHYLSELSVCG